MGYATTVPDSSSAVLLVMTHQEPSSHPLSAVPAIKVSWLVWVKRTATSVTKLNPREVSLPRNTQLNTVSSPTGTIWKKYGNMLHDRNHVRDLQQPSHVRLHPSCSLLVRLWQNHRYCCSTLVMVSPTTSQSMKVTPFPTPLPVWTWP